MYTHVHASAPFFFSLLLLSSASLFFSLLPHLSARAEGVEAGRVASVGGDEGHSGITHHCAEAIDRTPCDSVLEVRFPRLGGGEGLDRAHAGGAGSSQEDDVKLAVPLGGQAKARHGLSGKQVKIKKDEIRFPVREGRE